MESPRKAKGDERRGLAEKSIDEESVGLLVKESREKRLIEIDDGLLSEIFEFSEYYTRDVQKSLDMMEKVGGTKGLMVLFKTQNTGLSDDKEMLEQRERELGSNRREPLVQRQFWEYILDALDDTMMRILIAAGFLNLVINYVTEEYESDGEQEKRESYWFEGIGIFFAVIICTMVNSINDYQKSKQFKILQETTLSKQRSLVLRNGKQVELDSQELLVGDIVLLKEGEKIQADGIVLESFNLKVDESSLTGEPDQKPKSVYESATKAAQLFDKVQFTLISGSLVVEGEGKMLVTSVGKNSLQGKLNDILLGEDLDSVETPLQMKLGILAEQIGQVALVSALLIVVFLTARLFIEMMILQSWNTLIFFKQFLFYILLGVTIIVVAIPEGLPLSVTLSLAYSVKKMLDSQNLVRQLQSCETMGGANIILTDKTGTLTTNMSLSLYHNNHQLKTAVPQVGDVLQVDSQSRSLGEVLGTNDVWYKHLFVGSLALNSGNPTGRSQQQYQITDRAIFQFLERYKEFNESQEIRQIFDWKIVKKEPFNSQRKMMRTLVEARVEDSVIYRILAKGALEIILKMCSYQLEIEAMERNDENIYSQVKVERIREQAERLQKDSYRLIGLAFKDFETLEEAETAFVKDCEWILLGFIGLRDEIRPEVRESVRLCKKAGIRVVMVTGDNLETAKAIAKQCGIMREEHEGPEAGSSEGLRPELVMEGEEFMRRVGGLKERFGEDGSHSRGDYGVKNPEEFDKICEDLVVLARARPIDKQVLAVGFKSQGNVVAVTGDGTNDCLALKWADVGFAMGQNGTQIAIQASDIVILDDSFNSILQAVLWGRNIYDSIRKFLQFQLAVNISAIVCTLIGAIVYKQAMLTPIQLLWINLIMDSLAALALATDNPTIELLNKPPHKREEYIINRTMVRNIVSQSILQILVIMTIVVFGHKFLSEGPDSKFDSLIELKYERYQKRGLEWPEYLTPLWKVRYSNEEMSLAATGILYTPSLHSHKMYQHVKDIFDVPSRHFTFVFNVFVMLQIFNFINARKLKNEKNVFSGILTNHLFLYIILTIFVLQVLIISFGAKAFNCYPYDHGLNLTQWLLSILIASSSLLVSLITKLTIFNREPKK